MSTASHKDDESEHVCWELWRQDDNGVKVLVARYRDRREALARVEKFESSQHKQTYWIRKAVPSNSTAAPQPAPGDT